MRTMPFANKGNPNKYVLLRRLIKLQMTSIRYKKNIKKFGTN